MFETSTPMPCGLKLLDPQSSIVVSSPLTSKALACRSRLTFSPGRHGGTTNVATSSESVRQAVAQASRKRAGKATTIRFGSSRLGRPGTTR